MRLAQSPAFLESVANHPRVLPAVSEDGAPVRFRAHWSECVGIEWPPHGGFVFHRREPGVFEVHTLFAPRTPDTDGKARQALAHMFDNQGARVLLTQVAKDLPHVRRYAKRHGFRWFGEGPWGEVGAEYFILTREEWQGCPSQPSLQ